MVLRRLFAAGLVALSLGPACSRQSGAAGAAGSRTGATTSTTASSSTSATTGTGGQGGAPAGTFCAPDQVGSAPAGAAAFTVTTAHYQLYAETTQDQAVEMGRLLEAAFLAFEAWFKVTPATTGGLLPVKFYASEANWAAGLAADGITVPTEAGGYFSPTTRTAYLYVQPNPYYTHVLLLHEATHQFHELFRTKGQGLPFWYAEGHAEYLSRHDWDDHCVRLGVIPLLSWEDISGHALVESQSPGIDANAVINGPTVPDRPAAWAVFRYLDTGPYHDGFQSFRNAFDQNITDAAHSFAALVADPSTLSAPVAAWLPGVQEPMKPIFTEWTHVGPHAANGDSPGTFSLAIVKAPVMHFETAYDVPPATSWSAGLVLAYQDDQNYVAVVFSADKKLRTFTSTAGTALWNDAGTAPTSSGTTGTLAVDFGLGGTATVTVNGASTKLLIGTLPPVPGLAISDSQISFHDIAWK